MGSQGCKLGGEDYCKAKNYTMPNHKNVQRRKEPTDTNENYPLLLPTSNPIVKEVKDLIEKSGSLVDVDMPQQQTEDFYIPEGSKIDVFGVDDSPTTHGSISTKNIKTITPITNITVIPPIPNNNQTNNENITPQTPENINMSTTRIIKEVTPDPKPETNETSETQETQDTKTQTIQHSKNNSSGSELYQAGSLKSVVDKTDTENEESNSSDDDSEEDDDDVTDNDEEYLKLPTGQSMRMQSVEAMQMQLEILKLQHQASLSVSQTPNMGTIVEEN